MPAKKIKETDELEEKKSSPKKSSTKASEKKNTKKATAKSTVKKSTKKATTKSTVKKSIKKEKEVVVEEKDKSNTESVNKTEVSKEKSVETNDFDWNEFEQGIQSLNQNQINEFENLINENFVDTYNDNVIQGEVINITEREAIIDINAKSEGVISLNEFRYNPDLKIGDKVEVIVDVQEDKTGQLVLSHRKARTIKAWERVNEAHEKETVVTGFVKCRTKEQMI